MLADTSGTKRRHIWKLKLKNLKLTVRSTINIKTETNWYAKTIADKLSRTNKLRSHSRWLHELYLFFAVIIHMCLVKKPKLRDYSQQVTSFPLHFWDQYCQEISSMWYCQICMSMTMQRTFSEMNLAITLCTKSDPTWIICWLISLHHFPLMRILPLMVYVDFGEK